MKSIIAKAVDDRVDSEQSVGTGGLFSQSALARVELEDTIFDIAVGYHQRLHILFVCTAHCLLMHIMHCRCGCPHKIWRFQVKQVLG